MPAGRSGCASTAPTAPPTRPGGFLLDGVACRTSGSTAPAPGTTTAPPVTATTTATDPTGTSPTGTTPTGGTPAGTPSTTGSSATTPATTGAGGVLGTGRIQYGRTYSGDGTFYDATGAGNCMYEAGGDLMVAAMNKADYDNSAACGAFVQVTGPRGAVTVRIVDQCPECQPGDIDLSAQAFARIADPVVGRLRITWQLLSPALGGPLAYRYKEGSSQWWCGIQVRNHRNPVRTMEALVNGSWQQLPRQDYNYFLSANGAGCGKALRVTDIYGNQVTEGPVAIAVGVVQPGSGQFGVPG